MELDLIDSAQLATRGDIAELRHETRKDLAEMKTELIKAIAESQRWTITSIFAAMGIFAAIMKIWG